METRLLQLTVPITHITQPDADYPFFATRPQVAQNKGIQRPPTAPSKPCSRHSESNTDRLNAICVLLMHPYVFAFRSVIRQNVFNLSCLFVTVMVFKHTKVAHASGREPHMFVRPTLLRRNDEYCTYFNCLNFFSAVNVALQGDGCAVVVRSASIIIQSHAATIH